MSGERDLAWLTLRVHSALDAVGLTAAVSSRLAEVGISCNVIAGYHHDHLLVPVDDAAAAVEALTALALERRR
ncbi:ACT domain-containing protein [Rhodococcus sp. NPDC058514]|uniref:ACT domain-containing protein n=1 Tax=unclassified Rhodococcus (in: high G+C Gram-positive bacteria) TaxID=192944 RepID=UPI00364F678C